MRIRFLQCFFLIFVLSAALAAQIPNAGFKNWTGGEPDGWLTSNAPPLFLNITRSSAGRSGSSAVRGEVVSTMKGLASPLLQSVSKGKKGFSVDQKYQQLSGYYQFNAIGNDKLMVNLVMYKNGQAIAYGSSMLPPSLNYTVFSAAFNYLRDLVPDTCSISFQILGPAIPTDYHAGSYFVIDDLSFSGAATSAGDEKKTPKDYVLDQNYPNPFNPLTQISFSIPRDGFVSLKVYDLLGNVLAVLENEEKPAGDYRVNFNGTDLPSGFYIYELTAGTFMASRKMLLLK